MIPARLYSRTILSSLMENNKGKCQEPASRSPTFPWPTGLILLSSLKGATLLASKGDWIDEEVVCQMLFGNKKMDLASTYLNHILKKSTIFNVIIDSVRNNCLRYYLCYKRILTMLLFSVSLSLLSGEDQ